MKTVNRFLKWIVYYWVTSNERHLYEVGMIKGCLCLGYKSGPLDGYRDYFYDSSRKPIRTFVTFKEYMNDKA